MESTGFINNAAKSEWFHEWFHGGFMTHPLHQSAKHGTALPTRRTSV